MGGEPVFREFISLIQPLYQPLGETEVKDMILWHFDLMPDNTCKCKYCPATFEKSSVVTHAKHLYTKHLEKVTKSSKSISSNKTNVTKPFKVF